mgnify:CR=1 FL=1
MQRSQDTTDIKTWEKMKRLLFGELLLILITIIFIYLKPISRIYIADYLEKISLFLFQTVSDEDLNKWYEKRDKYKLLEELGGSSY